MQINAFVLLVPLEVVLVKMQFFLSFSSGMFWEEEKEEGVQTYNRKKEIYTKAMVSSFRFPFHITVCPKGQVKQIPPNRKTVIMPQKLSL